MEDQGKQSWPLAPFDATVDSQDLRREWEEWHRAFELVAELKRIQSQHEKLVMMLANGGRGLQRIFYNLNAVPEEVIPEQVKVPLMPLEVPEYDNAVKRLNKFFVGKRNDRVELEVFRSLNQSSDESFNHFVLKLRTQAARCEFNEREEKEILQQITMGARDERVRDKGLENVMNLDELTSYAINREVLLKQKEKRNPFKQEETLAPVQQKWIRQPAERSQYIDRSKFRGQVPASRSTVECNRCGSWNHDHNSRYCPARDVRCNKCDQSGHFARKCSRGSNGPARGVRCNKCGKFGHFARSCQGGNSGQRETSWKRSSTEANTVGARDDWKEEIPRRPKPEDVSKVE